jgi:hypothetical protein
MAAACIWVSQGVYIGSLVPVENRNEMYGLFWGIVAISGILGNLLSMVALKIFDFHVYFGLMVALGRILYIIT